MSRFLAPGCVITTGATRARVVLLTRVAFPLSFFFLTLVSRPTPPVSRIPIRDVSSSLPVYMCVCVCMCVEENQAHGGHTNTGRADKEKTSGHNPERRAARR